MIGSCIWKCYDWDKSGISILNAIRHKPYSFFLDSAINPYNLGRYSFLGCDPFFIFKIKNEKPFKKLRNLLNQYKLFAPPQLPNFIGGAVGFFSYDLGYLFEDIGSKAVDDLNLPDCLFGFYDVIIIVNHLLKKLYIVSSGLPEKNSSLAKKRAQIRLSETIKLLSIAGSGFNAALEADFIKNRVGQYEPSAFKSNFSKEQYLNAVKKALNYIREGDIYQINLSQRFEINNSSLILNDSFEIYKILRSLSPASFSAFLDCEDFKIISSSPERFLKLEGCHVETRPMKGTRPRGANDIEDARLKSELLNSKKDKAELIMIVDLLRNDLGRVCEYGSVRLKEKRALEEYATVFQTTSTIDGILHKNKDRIDLLKAIFPGGSITGCPKIRSMQIINELEPTRRGIYTGSLGYFSFAGDMDFNILIRTMLQTRDKTYFQVGGGIVSDSSPEGEYEETLVKAKALFSCLKGSIREKVTV